jgi:hypothetical protein
VAFTAKQERNGADMGGGGQNTAQPSVSLPGDIAALKAQAEAAAASVMGDVGPGQNTGEARGLLESPQGSGVDGHEIGSHGAMWEWDAGLAINDIEGGGSG